VIDMRLGDCLEVFRTIPDGSARMCVTSPPYFGLRDYGTAVWIGGDPDCDHLAGPLASSKSGLRNDGREHTGPYDGEKLVTHGMPYRHICGKCGAVRRDQQIGLEATPDAFVAKMVEVFREVRRVLADDGTLWLNMGDSYGSGNSGQTCRDSSGGVGGGKVRDTFDQPSSRANCGRPAIAGMHKQLLGIPWRVAFALQTDGWFLRSDIIWHKPNPMPESVRDRPTKAHEYVFLLSKQPRYYYDAEAVREQMAKASAARYNYGFGGAKNEALVEANKDGIGRRTSVIGDREAPSGRNARTVWTITPRPFKGAHFATFPAELAERCIKAGSSERGKCPECGAAWVRMVEKELIATRGKVGDRSRDALDTTRTDAGSQWGHSAGVYGHYETTTTGWRPTCSHDLEPVPDVVLDPFAGAGTVGLVCQRLGRDHLGVELNPAYRRMAIDRIASDSPMPLLEGIA
jgi:DNA modification methylase